MFVMDPQRRIYIYWRTKVGKHIKLKVLAKKVARIAGRKQAYRSRQVHHNSVRRQQGQQLMSMRTLGYAKEHRDRRERISAGRRSPTRSHTAIAAIAAPSPPPISAAQRRRIRH